MQYGISATILIFGLLLVGFSTEFPTFKGYELSVIASSIGSVICTAAIFSAYFEFSGPHAIAEYVWSEAKSAFEVKKAGIISFLEDASFANISGDIKRAKKIISVSTYSSRFLKRYERELSESLAQGATVRVVIQSPHSPTISAMKSLGWDEGDIQANFRANEHIATRLGKKGDFQLLFHKGVRAYSCVVLDDQAHISFATNSNGRHKVPKLILADGGDFTKFIIEDCNKLIDQCETNDEPTE
jgi:hypothetical protein